VSIYPVPDSTALESLLPTGNVYVASFAVTWENPDGSSLNAVTPVTLTITDPTIEAGDTIYEETSTGLKAVGTATVNGTVTVTFSSDPLFAVTSSQVAQAPLSITSTSGRFGTALSLTTSGGSGSGTLSFSVVNGTATGCSVTGALLTSLSAGTCVVTATKAADSSFDSVSSGATTIDLALPVVPSKVSTSFAAHKAALSAGARSQLRALAKKLIAGASVTVTGYAKGDATLAKARATAVANYLKSLVHVKVTLKTVTRTSANEVAVTTSKQ
jgi:hypothetical protein